MAMVLYPGRRLTSHHQEPSPHTTTRDRKERIAMTPVPDKAAAKSRAQAAGAKLPSDHQDAKEDVQGPKDTIITWPPNEDGHEYLIAGEAMDDAELLEHFTDENFVGALRIMLGPQQWRQYKDRARDSAGRVTASGSAEFLNHVLAEMKRLNS